ncbi:hypothetical protein ABFS82_05G107300 [Erythranthe guttata]
MSEKKEQVKPLAPTSHRIHIEEEETDTFSSEFMPAHHRRCIKCCGCSTAIFLIVFTTILILMFTVFRVKDPILKMNSTNITIQGMDNNSTTPSTFFGPGLNLTIEARVSIKNPNVASFKFDNTTTIMYYDGSVIGETQGPFGEVGPRRTLRMDVSIELMVDKIVGVGRFKSDISVGLLPISSYTRINGRVKISSAIRRIFVVKLNCTMNLNVSSRWIQDQNCRRRVSL